ncbi:MAG TPA: IclR family transcriptional regulator, partial [Geminicoccaceae bacterium]|nr:IclR family transcriptional regulator [Geminicoccaceae bacterium]
MPYRIAAVDRAFALLEVMAQYPDLGVTDLAERTGNTKSLVFRLLYTLEQRGYVQKSPDARTYSLGYRTLFLAEHTRRQSALIAAAAPVLDELAHATRENALLVVREDLHAVCIAMRESPQPLRLFAQVGRHVPLHAGGGPKILLAFAPEEVRRAILERPLEGFTATSIIDHQKLARTLGEIRQAGFTLSIGELDADVFSMAAPVRDFSGEVVAALTVAGPVSRLTAAEGRRFRKLILDAADRL